MKQNVPTVDACKCVRPCVNAGTRVSCHQQCILVPSSQTTPSMYFHTHARMSSLTLSDGAIDVLRHKHTHAHTQRGTSVFFVMFIRCEHLGTKQIDCPLDGVMEGVE